MTVRGLYHYLYEAYRDFPNTAIRVKVNGEYYHLDEVAFITAGFSSRRNGIILHASKKTDKRRKAK